MSLRLLPIVALLALSGCASDIANIGRSPELSPITNPQMITGRRDVVMPMPAVEPEIYASNSLWRTGARNFFNDPRAAKVGDILTVQIAISDRANLANSSKGQSSGTRQSGITGLFGLETKIPQMTGGGDPENLIGMSSDRSFAGQGSVQRSETIELTVAALVTQVLPNGNLVVAGRQEVRVNNERRDLTVSGIVRPQDITSANTVKHSQIAEARISYGGAGMVTDNQKVPLVQQALGVLLPF